MGERGAAGDAGVAAKRNLPVLAYLRYGKAWRSTLQTARRAADGTTTVPAMLRDAA